jgi:hypothetical protein
MSRIYGELPEVMSQRAMTEMALSGEKCFAETTGSQVDESIFSHDLAYLEAAVEERDRQDALPWIPLQNQNFRSGSAPATVEDSA